MSARTTVACLAPLLVALAGAPSRAQVPRLDPAPWYAVTDSTTRRGVVFGLDRFWDDDTGWSVGRLGITVTAPLGLRSVYFLRAHAMRFDTGERPVLTRWPGLRGEGAQDDWPGSVSPSGLARPELGLIVPLPLPLAGLTDAAITMGLPLGSDALYPFSAGSWPLRIDVRRTWRRGTAWRGAIKVGAETTFDSSDDVLTADAFPSGWCFAAEAAWQPATWRQFAVAFEERRLAGHAICRATLAAWLPLGDESDVGLVLARELGIRADRAATNEVSLLWRFAGLSVPEAGESR
jgi:hypothetical protein